MTLKELVVGLATQIRSICMIGLHAFINVKRKCTRKNRFIYLLAIAGVLY